ncbi:hypothetical protein IFM89_031260 [Coptis chinensis]|uniref:Replication protein A 70 kDa DNA-binding subunit B/D first OB fold domain-containing protein n=1 Tax=Coptis chinensis TaxID=261450 RepID=A0A835IZ58_9MAGN|nr:hypothetical protein IFM89_031260 [Coptis chinensis]
MITKVRGPGSKLSGKVCAKSFGFTNGVRKLNDYYLGDDNTGEQVLEIPWFYVESFVMGHYTMENKYTGLAELNQKTDKCIVKARVSRLWFPFNPLNRKQTFGIDMLLIDEKGDQIHAKVQDSLKDKFREKLEEGKIYTFEKFEVDKEDKSYRPVRFNCKILFTKATIVTPTNEDDKSIENYKFTFVGFEKFLATEDASACDLKDIITILKKIGNKNHKGYEKTVALWGEMSDTIANISNKEENVIVIRHPYFSKRLKQISKEITEEIRPSKKAKKMKSKVMRTAEYQANEESIGEE